MAQPYQHMLGGTSRPVERRTSGSDSMVSDQELADTVRTPRRTSGESTSLVARPRMSRDDLEHSIETSSRNSKKGA